MVFIAWYDGSKYNYVKYARVVNYTNGLNVYTNAFIGTQNHLKPVAKKGHIQHYTGFFRIY